MLGHYPSGAYRYHHGIFLRRTRTFELDASSRPGLAVTNSSVKQPNPFGFLDAFRWLYYSPFNDTRKGFLRHLTDFVRRTSSAFVMSSFPLVKGCANRRLT